MQTDAKFDQSMKVLAINYCTIGFYEHWLGGYANRSETERLIVRAWKGKLQLHGCS